MACLQELGAISGLQHLSLGCEAEGGWALGVLLALYGWERSASSGIWYCPLWQVSGKGRGLGLCQEEELHLKSGVGIGVETA